MWRMDDLAREKEREGGGKWEREKKREGGREGDIERAFLIYEFLFGLTKTPLYSEWV